jgi:pentatricopeptide repeat protein
MEDLYASGYGVVKPNARSWNIVLNSYAKAGQLFHAETLVEQFMHASKENRVDGKPNTRTWNSLLAACAKKNDVHKAKQFWRHMQECGIPPNIVSYNTLLSCYARSTVMKTQDVGKDIEAIFRQLQQEDSNVTPNRITYLALINAWIGGAGRPEKAESILKDICKNHAMNDAAIRPDRDLFHKVLAAWSDQKSPRRAESLFLMMVELHERHGYTDLKPTVETYNRLLNAWAKSMEREAGERADLILRQMEDFARAGDKDVCPDLITYNSVLNAWANSGDPIAVTRVERLVLEMILKGNPKLTPTIVSYGTWLKAIDTSNEDDKDRRAQEVLKTMKIHKLEPTDFIRRKVESLTKPTDNMEPTGKTVQ